MAKQKRVFSIGLIGENPNDSNALVALLKQRYEGRFAFTYLGKHRTGDQLSNPKMLRVLQTEFAAKQPALVIYIRDLDALASSTTKWQQRQAEFAKIKQIVGEEALFLLHVYQFEALILADIDAFNRQYRVSYSVKGDPTMVEKPKQKLMSATDKPKAARQYHENDSAEIAAKLDYAKLVKNCGYFRDFDAAFAAKLPKQ
ncbi:DUF4276 family protein [Hymenobacter antarcticus]|uniref:DUF4276 family protein n=1 Tax=Hymenobacter antarcticus TaxID=486270 RepID=A0ABP7QZK1_9BACT